VSIWNKLNKTDTCGAKPNSYFCQTDTDKVTHSTVRMMSPVRCHWCFEQIFRFWSTVDLLSRWSTDFFF